MSVSGLQREDLLRFGREVARKTELRIIRLHNVGRITDTEYAKLMSCVPHPQEVVQMLDGFEEKCLVDVAVNELVPLPSLLRATPQTANRVRTALRALRGGDG